MLQVDGDMRENRWPSAFPGWDRPPGCPHVARRFHYSGDRDCATAECRSVDALPPLSWWP